MTPSMFGRMTALYAVLIAARQVCRHVVSEGQTPDAQKALQDLENAISELEKPA